VPCRTLASLFAFHLAGLPVALCLSALDHGVAAGFAALVPGALAVPAWLRCCLLRGPEAPRRLRWTAEGEFTLDLAGGRSLDVRPSGRSVIGGPWRVLLLQASGLNERVVIEVARYPAAAVASLDRALRRVAAAPGVPRHGLRSLIAPGGRGY
jgi:hypothetical protein